MVRWYQMEVEKQTVTKVSVSEDQCAPLTRYKVRFFCTETNRFQQIGSALQNPRRLWVRRRSAAFSEWHPGNRRGEDRNRSLPLWWDITAKFPGRRLFKLLRASGEEKFSKVTVKPALLGARKGGGGRKMKRRRRRREGWAGDDVYALGFKDLLLQGNSDLKVYFCQRDLRFFF